MEGEKNQSLGLVGSTCNKPPVLLRNASILAAVGIRRTLQFSFRGLDCSTCGSFSIVYTHKYLIEDEGAQAVPVRGVQFQTAFLRTTFA